MSDSNPIKQEPDPQTNRLCDFCTESPALLYCRADSAKLCLTCDREVHSTNELFKKHTRLILCDSCDSAPASVFCSTHTSVLCQNCDWETHTSSSSSAHDRRPLEGFSGCPSVTELLGVFGFEDIRKKSLLGGDGTTVNSDLSGPDYGFDDFLVWDTPSFISLDDLIVSSGSHHNFQAMGVPPLPKNRNAICGKYKAEMLNQLRELAKLEPNSDDGGDDIADKIQDASYPDFEQCLKQHANPQYELQSNSYKWLTDPLEIGNGGGTYNENNRLVPEKDSDNFDSNINTNTNNNDNGTLIRSWNEVVANESIQVPKVRELTPQERDTAISRYKEKKKNRRYDKHIRYESRKVRAESRTRIKGRFAKVD